MGEIEKNAEERKRMSHEQDDIKTPSHRTKVFAESNVIGTVYAGV
jgi:hypothetical protein